MTKRNMLWTFIALGLVIFWIGLQLGFEDGLRRGTVKATASVNREWQISAVKNGWARWAVSEDGTEVQFCWLAKP